jgi:hypothetical protein
MTKKVDDKKIKVSTDKNKEFTIRQFFYSEKQMNEPLISALERTYGDQKKNTKDWVEIISSKGIVF